MRSTQIRAFIFDLDGVLADTAEHHFQSWKQLADEEGIPFTRQDNEALKGVSRRESLFILLNDRSIREDQAQEWMARKNRYYLERIDQLSPKDLLPGALELLQGARKRGYKVAIASASKNAAGVVERLGLLPEIDILVDGNSVSRTKPEPDLFLIAARQLGEPPETCVVVEDAAAGIDAAKAAGMRTVGLGPPEQVGAADLVLPAISGSSLSEIVEQLEGLGEDGYY